MVRTDAKPLFQNNVEFKFQDATMDFPDLIKNVNKQELSDGVRVEQIRLTGVLKQTLVLSPLKNDYWHISLWATYLVVAVCK